MGMTTKTGTATTTTREERKLLEDAAEIIRRELASGQEVRIRGLGRFKVSRIKVNMGIPGENKGEQRIIGIVRFRPFDQLKKFVRDTITVEDEGDEGDNSDVVTQESVEDFVPPPLPVSKKEIVVPSFPIIYPPPISKKENPEPTPPTKEEEDHQPVRRKINW